MNTKHKSLAMVAATALLLAACGTSTGGTVSPAPAQPSTTTSEPAPSGTPMESVAPTETPAQDSSTEIFAKFGEKITWDNGLAVSVSTPKHLVPGEWAMGAGQKTKDAVVFTVTLTNKTGQRFNPSGFSVQAAGPNGDLDQLFDSENGIGTYPTVTMKDGKTVTWKIAFWLPDKTLTGITMQVSPDFAPTGYTYKTAVFEN